MKKPLFALIFIVAVIALLGILYGNRKSAILPSPSDSGADGFTNLGSTSADSLDNLTKEELERLFGGASNQNTIDYGQLKRPATCNVGGTVRFKDLGTAEILGARITYTGIDSPARQIKWLIAPSDDLSIGPNIAASLVLPDGSENIIVVLPERPKAKQYRLTASITYGRLEGEGIIVRETGCTGSTKVILNF